MRYTFLRFPEGKFKAVTLSYDDGVSFDKKLAGILDKFGMKGTFNINSAFLKHDGRISIESMKEDILGKGHEIAVHGHNHMAPGAAFKPVLGINDILKCRTELENIFDMIIRGMAYPDSGIRKMHGENSYESIRSYIKDLGIVYSRTLGGDNDDFLLPNDFFAWMPTAHHKNPKLMEMVEKFLAIDEHKLYSASMFPRLFYLWGHSYEFNNDNNWNVIEDFCEKISGKDDTWYATNIEICEYVEAYNSLVASADAHKIYNPTLKEIWLNVDGKTMSVKPGETINI